MLAAKAKRDLATAIMNGGETVDEFYPRLLQLWEDADTPEDERMNKFEETLRPSIALTIRGHDFADMEAMLIKARSIEDKGRINSNIYVRNDSIPSAESSRPYGNNNSAPRASVDSVAGAIRPPQEPREAQHPQQRMPRRRRRT